MPTHIAPRVDASARRRVTASRAAGPTLARAVAMFAFCGLAEALEGALEVVQEGHEVRVALAHRGCGAVGALRVQKRVVEHRRAPWRAAADRVPRRRECLRVIRGPRRERLRRRGARVGQAPERRDGVGRLALLEPRDVALRFRLCDGRRLARREHDERAGDKRTPRGLEPSTPQARAE